MCRNAKALEELAEGGREARIGSLSDLVSVLSIDGEDDLSSIFDEAVAALGESNELRTPVSLAGDAFEIPRAFRVVHHLAARLGRDRHRHLERAVMVDQRGVVRLFAVSVRRRDADADSRQSNFHCCHHGDGRLVVSGRGGQRSAHDFAADPVGSPEGRFILRIDCSPHKIIGSRQGFQKHPLHRGSETLPSKARL